MKSLYDAEYYEKGIENGVSCYTNYRWIPELTIPMAARIIEYLDITEDDRILDYGCAKGYLVYALRLLHREAYGFDISEYAIRNAPQDVSEYVSNSLDSFGTFDWIISKDVFEHIEYDEIDALIRKLAKCTRKMFVVVPLGDGKKYVIPAYEFDRTHVIREDLEWWKKLFEKNGFCVKNSSYSVKYIKENWTKWDTGNGFFVLDSIN